MLPAEHSGREKRRNESESPVLFVLYLFKTVQREKIVKYLVGLMTRAPIAFFLNLLSRLARRSSTGITNARVFPDPVTASTTTSLCFMNNGMVEAWTGVI